MLGFQVGIYGTWLRVLRSVIQECRWDQGRNGSRRERWRESRGSPLHHTRVTLLHRPAHGRQVCSRLRLWYKASMKLQFNLLMFLRYVSPPAVLTALYKARKRVYRKYGTRVQRQK